MSIKKIKKILHTIGDYIFPRHCVLCGKFLFVDNEYNYLCDTCANHMPYLFGNRCIHCGKKLNIYPTAQSYIHEQNNDNQSKYSSNNHYINSPYNFFKYKKPYICSRCLEQQPAYTSALSAVKYDTYTKLLVHEWKYRDGTYLSSDIAKLCYSKPHIYDYLSHSILVPVPLHWRRRWTREYNQSEQMAKYIAKNVKNSQYVPLLIKTKHTQPQVKLTNKQRKYNIVGAFDINNTYKQQYLCHRIVLIDDVLTTGSTLNACAHTLHAYGYKNVHIFTFSRRE